MTKQELVAAIAKVADISKAAADRALNGMIDSITGALKKGGKVTITGFGTFSVSNRSARKGVNPRNPSQTIQIPAMKTPHFKAGKTFKEAIR